MNRDPIHSPDRSDSPPSVPFVDMEPLVRRLRDTVAGFSTGVRVQEVAEFDRQAFVARTGFAARGAGAPEIVLAGDVAVELGHPRTASQSFVLLTSNDAVLPGRVSRVGPELRELDPSTPNPFGQVVLLRIAPGGAPDPFTLDNAQYLTNRLPGYMVRSMPGRLWARVSRRGLAHGLDLATLGQALMAAYLELPDVEAVEVVFVTSSEADVWALGAIAAEAKILAGRHKKLVLSPDGEVECTDLDCEDCEEQPVCDALRDVVVKRRRKAGTSR